ncbi:Uncharacterised protein [Cronobacter sakazakii]|nr:Uncharacterised protein [Cronobacter sakazakii]
MFLLHFATELGFCKIGVHGLAVVVFHHDVIPRRGAQLGVYRQFIDFRFIKRVFRSISTTTLNTLKENDEPAGRYQICWQSLSPPGKRSYPVYKGRSIPFQAT